jgi:glutamine synthetase type III
MLEPVMTFGGVVIAGMLAAMATVLVAKLNVVSKKVDTTVKQTVSTGNGYADKTTKTLEEVRESLRNLHRRIDAQNAHTQHRDDHLDGVLMKFDDRLTYIEEKI